MTYFICVNFIDVRRDDDLSSSYYFFESLVLVSLSFSSSLVAYRLLTPGKKVSNLKRILFISLGLYLASLFYRMPTTGVANQFLLESDISRGGCGVLIGIFSLASFGALYSIVLRKGYVFKKGLFSFSLACATCSIGTISMQVICEHESVAHVLVYHAPPFVALGLIFYLWQRIKA